MDVLANTLLDCTDENARQVWLANKLKLPKNISNPVLTGQLSPHGHLLLMILEYLVDEYPCEEEDLNDFTVGLYDALTSNFGDFLLFNPIEEYLKHKTKDDSLCIVLGIAIGYYCSMIESTMLFMLLLCEEFSKVISPLDFQLDILICTAFTIWNLGNTGYFGRSTLMEITDRHLCPKELLYFVDMCCNNNLNYDFLSQEYDTHNFNKLSNMSKNLSKCFYHMMRVDTAYRGNDFQSLPREQLPEILDIDIYSQVTPLLFGALCTMSERQHPLIQNHIRNNRLYTQRTKNLFKFI